MITSAQAETSAGVPTSRPSSAAFCRDLALGQTDLHLDPGVTQGQRVRVPLGAVADHGDLAALDDRQVGVGVVVDVDTHGSGTVPLGGCVATTV
jgi:hypothetical protein